MAKAGRVADHGGQKHPWNRKCPALSFDIAGECRESQQCLRCGGIARWHGVVEEFLGPEDERLVVRRRVEEAALARVAELLDHDAGDLPRPGEPAAVEGGLVEA